MRKLITLLLGVTLIFSMSACEKNGVSSSEQSQSTSPSVSSEQSQNLSPSATADSGESSLSSQPTTKNAKPLVVYFSMPETADPNNMTKAEEDSTVVINGEVLGNTQYVAQLIQENTGGDMFRIEPKTPYPTDHDILVDLADKEQEENARPELAENVENLDQYDVIFLGYPNWWGDMPMILYSFLEGIDLSGKTVIPFNTHGGSGFSNTISAIAQLQPNATVNENGFTVSRNNVQDCAADVSAWLKEHGFVK